MKSWSSRSPPFDKISQFLHHLINASLVAFKILGSIDDKYFCRIIFLKPFLVFIVHHLQIFKRYFLFFFSFPQQSSLETFLRRTVQVYYLRLVYGCDLLEGLI